MEEEELFLPLASGATLTQSDYFRLFILGEMHFPSQGIY